ncbi:MAG: hypothetical protein ACRCSV_02935 [Chlamydiales bacterium]
MGSLIIHGNYTQSAYGSLHIQLRPNGTHDTLEIHGTASIDGAIHLDFIPGIYDSTNSYTFINTNSLVGLFIQITSNKPGIGIIDFETNQVTFTLINPEVILPMGNENEKFLTWLRPEIYGASLVNQKQTIYYPIDLPRPTYCTTNNMPYLSHLEL